MNYQEARTLAQAWTQGIDVNDEGWRGVMTLLLARIDEVERSILFDMRSPKTLADVIRQTQGKTL